MFPGCSPTAFPRGQLLHQPIQARLPLQQLSASADRQRQALLSGHKETQVDGTQMARDVAHTPGQLRVPQPSCNSKVCFGRGESRPLRREDMLPTPSAGLRASWPATAASLHTTRLAPHHSALNSLRETRLQRKFVGSEICFCSPGRILLSITHFHSCSPSPP